MLQGLRLANALEGRPLDLPDQRIDPLQDLPIRALPIRDNPPRRARRTRVSLRQLPFHATAGFQFSDGLQKSAGILGAA